MKIENEMMKRFVFAIALALVWAGCRKEDVQLANAELKLSWEKSGEGWKVIDLQLQAGGAWKKVGVPSGQYTLLFSEGKPDSTATIFKANTGVQFPEKVYHYQQD